jgi:hypothetical protein
MADPWPPIWDSGITILFVSSNGVGMGHLVRQVAIWRRMHRGTRGLFLTTCPAFGLFAAPGRHVEYFPSDIHSNLAIADWNAWFGLRLEQLVRRHDVRMLVLDANVPFPAVLNLRASFPHIRLVWVRRAMWKDHPEDIERLLYQTRFDLVIEPGDIAESYDTGPTLHYRQGVVRVPPILLHDLSEALDRSRACAALGLSPEAVNICIQLGAEVADNAVDIVSGLCRNLGGRDGLAPLWLRSILAPARPGLEAVLPTARVFPLSRYMAAFDIAVSAAGYNTFHELHQAGIPTVFLPNTAPGMDNQAARADFAADAGWARRAARSVESVIEQITPLLDPYVRIAMRARMAELPPTNGAAAAADALLTLAALS